MGQTVCPGNDKTACHGAGSKDIVVISWSCTCLVRSGKVTLAHQGPQSVTVDSSTKSLSLLNGSCDRPLTSRSADPCRKNEPHTEMRSSSGVPSLSLGLHHCLT
jgi:hypothetical protein